jgi:hypothetical protein
MRMRAPQLNDHGGSGGSAHLGHRGNNDQGKGRQDQRPAGPRQATMEAHVAPTGVVDPVRGNQATTGGWGG